MFITANLQIFKNWNILLYVVTQIEYQEHE